MIAREYLELHRLVLATHTVVESDAGEDEEDETEDDSLPVVEHEIAGGDDDDVARHNHLTETHILVFVHHRGNDVRTAHAAVGQKTETEAHAHDDTAQDTRHEEFVAHQMRQSLRHRVACQKLEQPQPQCGH